MSKRFKAPQNIKFLAWDYQLGEINVVRAMQIVGHEKFAVLGRSGEKGRLQQYKRPLDELELLQFTNEYDINKKEIYENDILTFPKGVILKTKEYTGVVVRMDSAFVVHRKNLKDVVKHARKVGNIYTHYEARKDLLSRVDRVDWNPYS